MTRRLILCATFIAASGPVTTASSTGLAQDDTSAEPPAIAYRMTPIGATGIELPVPVDWVPLPSGDMGGVEALFVSPADRAELDVFAVPFQSMIGGKDVKERAHEIEKFVNAGKPWQMVLAKAVEAGNSQGIAVRAVWPRTDGDADVFALAMPVEGKTVLVVLLVERHDASPFDTIARMMIERTSVTAPACQTPPPVQPVETGGFVWKDGRGFSVTLPAGWRRIAPCEVESRGQDESGKRALAEAVDAGEAEMESEDVEADMLGFVKPGIHRQSPNVVVGIAPFPFPVNAQSLDEFQAHYRELLGPRTSPYKLDAATIVQISGRASFSLEGRTDIPGESVRQTQLFVPMGGQALVLTISVPSELAKALEGDIRSIVDSVVIDGPRPAIAGAEPQSAGKPGTSPSWKRFIPLAFAGLVAAILAAWLLVRRRPGRG